MSNPLDDELKALNAKVDAALAERKAWMDAHMKDYARWQVGEVLYNLENGSTLGTISKLYRYQAEHNPFYDTSMSIDYEFQMSPNCFSNTSRLAGSFGNLRELAALRKSQAEFLHEQVAAEPGV